MLTDRSLMPRARSSTLILPDNAGNVSLCDTQGLGFPVWGGGYMAG